MRKTIGGALLGAALGLAAMPANADIVETYEFHSDHCTDGCLTNQARGGTITITDHGTGVIDFNVQLENGNLFVGGGFNASFGFNLVDNPTIAYSNINPASGWLIPNAIPVNQQAAGQLHMDGTGDFEYGLDVMGNGFANNQGPSLTFTIAAANLDIHDFQGNALDQYWAADIYSGTTGKTRAIDASNGVTVPEPSSLALLGAGLVGSGLALRRRRKNAAA